MGLFWIYIAVILFIVSGPLRSVPLLLVATTVLLLAGVSRLWARYCLTRLDYVRGINPDRVFPGDEVELVLQLTNRKALPLPWVQVDEELPDEVTLLGGRTEVASSPSRMVLKNLFSLGWYHRITRRYVLCCPQRGHFPIGPALVRSGDFFGLFNREISHQRDCYLTVYPRVLPVVYSRVLSRESYGTIRAHRNILEDTTRPMGIREYIAGDSLKHIHWKASARIGRLQTRIYEASTTPNYVIFLDVRTTPPAMYGTRVHLLELGVLTVTALANDALEHGYTTGVYVNQTARYSSRLLQVPPSQHPEQLVRILETMAQVHPSESIPMPRLIGERSRNLPWGATVLLIAAVPDHASIEALTRMRSTGRSAALVQVGGVRDDLQLYGVPAAMVSDEDDWRKLEEITLQ